MKKTVVIAIFVLLLAGCDGFGDKYGTINHKVHFTTQESGSMVKSFRNGSVETYDKFGTYITSLTPSVFTAKINIMVYQDNWDIKNDQTHMISYVEGSDTSDQVTPIYADFSGNREVSYTPILYSTDLRGDRVFAQKEVTFSYFNFCPEYFYQKFDIPGEYDGIDIFQFNEQQYNDTTRIGNVLRVMHHTLVGRLFSCGMPIGYVFGNTDSTFIYNENCQSITPSENLPFGGVMSSPVIRSNNYEPLTVTMPGEGETFEMYSTVSFDTQTLVQVYAGNDNIPYTSDDIFVYAPNYWERLKVKLEVRVL